MSESTSLSLNLPGTSDVALHEDAEALDFTIPHSFSFVRQRWFAGAGSALKGVLMAGTGVFLLTQIAGTPNLAIQIAILGTLLVVGGLAFLVASLSDFFGGVKVDPAAIRIRFGLIGYTIPWSRVAQWQVNEAVLKSASLNCLELELTSPTGKRSIPGGYLAAESHYLLRRLLHAFAPGKECARFAS